MAIIKCKMCGGNLNIIEGASTAECEFCGSVQTVPKVDDEKKLTLFARANRLRLACEFDKAAGIYEAIVADFPEEAEAYWGLVLCKYGIEYVDDPATGKKIPTCHRSSFDSILEDSDFEQAQENADATAQKVYREEAKQFERIRKGILEVSSTENPYDIFICYKETNEKGDRTLDSVLAQDLYSALTDKGYRVFFSRITLQGKLGEAYEPYIFAALNSAKVMLAVGTCYEYYNAVWVKNEWSRYLKLCLKDKSKHLIPCYKNLDPEDMPKEFNHLQGADLGKMGAVQDILFNMEKYIPLKKETTTVIQEKVVVGGNTSTESLLKRAFMFLEDGDWHSANQYCEKVLDIDPENAQAYLGKLMAELKVKKQDDLKNQTEPFDGKNNYQKVLRFADDWLKATLTGYIDYIHVRNEEAARSKLYNKACNLMKLNSISGYEEATQLFQKLPGYRNADALALECQAKEQETRKDVLYSKACDVLNDTHQWAGKETDVQTYEQALDILRSLNGWRDSNEKILLCEKKIQEAKVLLEQERQQQEQARLEAQRRAELARKEAQRTARRNKKIGILAAVVGCAIIAFVIVINTVIIPNNRYNDAIALMEAGKYSEAIFAFEAMDGYKDSNDKIEQCQKAIQDIKYNDAVALMNAGHYRDAIDAFREMTGYRDSAEQIVACQTLLNDSKYNDAVALKEAGKYTEAISAFTALDGYKDSANQIVACETAILDGKYSEAVVLLENGKLNQAAMAFGAIADHRDARERSFALWDKIAVRSSLAFEYDTLYALKADGTMSHYAVSKWENIIAISADYKNVVGLKADGTVVAYGDNKDGEGNVTGWKDIVAVSAGQAHTVGLKSDGTVVTVGSYDYGKCAVSDWTDIIAISTGSNHTVGLKADGTVVATGRNSEGQCNVSAWKNIVAISADGNYTAGLKADGTVVSVGDHSDGLYGANGWKDIVAISAGGQNIVGLKADGSVVAAGDNEYGQCNVSNWTNIIAICSGYTGTVGLQSDGTVVAVGEYANHWSNYKNIKTD